MTSLFTARSSCSTSPTAWSFFLLISAFCLISCSADEGSLQNQQPKEVTLQPDSAVMQNRSIEQQQLSSSEVADGFEVMLWASERLLGDPVGLDIDHTGRAFVTVTNRSGSSEFDIRGHLDWVPKSITWTSLEERRNFIHEEFAPEKSEENREAMPDRNEDGSHDWRDLAVEQEEIYIVEDRSGDGVADRSHRFIQDFHTEVTDVLGTVLYDDRTGNVFAGVAPDLWRLEDRDKDGMADFKQSISHGYKMHIGFGGHGMSGLNRGPDGKIYWAIGDFGVNITDKSGKKWYYPNQGVIARANPDGSDFEIFAHGVRNTHEFDFDKYGNLISVDNDGDHAGESERIVHLIHGSDSGWRINWQFGKYSDPKNNDYKVWMDEEYFKPRHTGQTAHILPPLALYHAGPSGFVYNPGTALSKKWKEHFFMTSFTGSAGSSVNAFTLKPQGASFELEQTHVIQRGILGTSMDFGPDGALYVSDWIEGWDTNDKGRIWKIDTPESSRSELRQETQRLLKENFANRSEEELFELLKHEDMRVRQKAQFELVERGDSGFETLVKATEQTGHRLARIHGIWGIGQFARKDPAYAKPLLELLNDSDSEVKAQAAKTIGNESYQPAAEPLIPLLRDEAPRVRMYAAEALGKLEYSKAIQPILEMLKENNDEDIYLRQAGAIALSRIGEAEPLVALHDSPSRALRVAAVVALKRLGDPGVARFLKDEDRYIVTDAARAIGDDQFIKEALPDLAGLLENPRFGYEPLTRRVLNANLYVGTPEAANRTAGFAASPDATEEMRVEALRILGVWSKPSHLDRITGRFRGWIERDSAIAREAVQPVLAQLFSADAAAVREATAGVTGKLQLEQSRESLVKLLREDSSAEVRIAALNALSSLGHESMNELMQVALDARDQKLRMAALEKVPALSIPAEQKVQLLTSVLKNGSTDEQQTALNSLGEMQHPEAVAALDRQLDRLMNGKLKEEIQLDVVLAVEESDSEELLSRLKAYRAKEQSADAVEQFSSVLKGGESQRGRRLFYQHEAAQCVRCHSMGDAGGKVGPPLNNIGSRLSRKKILESLVEPGARIAPGYGTVSVTLKDGSTVQGVVQSEDSETLVLQSADGESQKVAKSNIRKRQNAPSSMPPMGTILSRREMRDIVEFLANQQ